MRRDRRRWSWCRWPSCCNRWRSHHCHWPRPRCRMPRHWWRWPTHPNRTLLRHWPSPSCNHRQRCCHRCWRRRCHRPQRHSCRWRATCRRPRSCCRHWPWRHCRTRRWQPGGLCTAADRRGIGGRRGAHLLRLAVGADDRLVVLIVGLPEATDGNTAVTGGAAVATHRHAVITDRRRGSAMCNRAGANRMLDEPAATAPSPSANAPASLPASGCARKRAVPSAVLATASSCALFTASVACVPAATLTIWRSLPLVPTATVLARLSPNRRPARHCFRRQRWRSNRWPCCPCRWPRSARPVHWRCRLRHKRSNPARWIPRPLLP